MLLASNLRYILSCAVCASLSPHTNSPSPSFEAQILSIACVAGAITYIGPTVGPKTDTHLPGRSLKTDRADRGQTDVIISHFPPTFSISLHRSLIYTIISSMWYYIQSSSLLEAEVNLVLSKTYAGIPDTFSMFCAFPRWQEQRVTDIVGTMSRQERGGITMHPGLDWSRSKSGWPPILWGAERTFGHKLFRTLFTCPPREWLASSLHLRMLRSRYIGK